MYVNGPTNDETTASDVAPRTPISPRANPYGYADYEGLGFSLKPPKFIRKAVKKIGKTGAIIGAVASVLPLPGGSIASRVASSTVGKLFHRGEKISKQVKGAVKRVAVSPVAPSLPIPVAMVEPGASTAPTMPIAPTASPTGGVVPEVQLVSPASAPSDAAPTVERMSTAQRVLRAGRQLSGNIDKARAAADSLSKAAQAAADAGDELGARRLADQARAVSAAAGDFSSGAAQASGAVQGAAEGAVTGAAAATASDQAKKFLETTTGKVVAGTAIAGGLLLLTSGKGGSSQSWR